MKWYSHLSYILLFVSALIAIIQTLWTADKSGEQNRLRYGIIALTIIIFVISAITKGYEIAKAAEQERSDSIYRANMKLELASANSKLSKADSLFQLKGLIDSLRNSVTRGYQMRTLDSITAVLGLQNESLKQITGGEAYAVVEFEQPEKIQTEPFGIWKVGRKLVNTSKYMISNLYVQILSSSNGLFFDSNFITENQLVFSYLNKRISTYNAEFGDNSNSKRLDPIFLSDKDTSAFFFIELYQRNRDVHQYTKFQKVNDRGYMFWTSATMIQDRYTDILISGPKKDRFFVPDKDGKITWSIQPLYRK